MRSGFFGGLIFAFLFLFNANFSYADGKAFIFDNYSLGDLNGQDGWIADTSLDVVNAPFGRSGKAVGITTNVVTDYGERNIFSNITVGQKYLISGYWLSGAIFTRPSRLALFEGSCSVSGDFDPELYWDPLTPQLQLGNYQITATTTPNTWYYFEFEIDTSSNQYRMVNWGNQSTSTPWVTDSDCSGSIMDATFSIGYGAYNGNEDVYWDDLYIESIGSFEDLSTYATSTIIAMSRPTDTQIFVYDPLVQGPISQTEGYVIDFEYTYINKVGSNMDQTCYDLISLRTGLQVTSGCRDAVFSDTSSTTRSFRIGLMPDDRFKWIAYLKSSTTPSNQ